MTSDSDRFVLEANIERFRNLLTTKLSPGTRVTVTMLLKESEAELRRLTRRPMPWPRSYGDSVMVLCGILATLAQAV